MDKLAINGGNAVRDTFLSYGKQSISEEDINFVSGVLRGDYLTTGPYVETFEEKIADYVGAKYAVAVCNGTAALHMACDAVGLKPGDEVIVSPLTFAASANCILYMGAKPVFADINPDTLNIDPLSIKSKITTRTKAIIPVHFSGNPADLDSIQCIARENQLHVIEDAAHALGATYKNTKIGALSDLTEFSFHPVKPITTGEGGIVTTNDDKLYKKMKLFRSHGITRDRSLINDKHGDWYYEQLSLGYNYRIPDINCALGISQLQRLDEFTKRRRQIAHMYDEKLCELGEIELPIRSSIGESSYHIYVIRLKLDYLTVGRRKIYDALRAENIGVNVHYIPVYYHPHYAALGYKKGLCKNAEESYERIITLPIHPSMDDNDVYDVINAVNKVIKKFRI